MRKIFRIIPCAVVVACILSLSPAHAHRVNVFCWVEGKTIHCQSSFAGGDPVQNGELSVRTQSGETLLSGKTDKQGKFSFSTPAADQGDLRVTVQAGMGHKGAWPIKSGEYIPENEKSGKSSGDKTQTGKEKPKKSMPADAFSTANADGLQAVVQNALQKELAPVKKELARLRQDRITLQDILSGLGYILGLMGIALYFKAKKS
jgi:nickel transport protein